MNNTLFYISEILKSDKPIHQKATALYNLIKVDREVQAPKVKKQAEDETIELLENDIYNKGYENGYDNAFDEMSAAGVDLSAVFQDDEAEIEKEREMVLADLRSGEKKNQLPLSKALVDTPDYSKGEKSVQSPYAMNAS